MSSESPLASLRAAAEAVRQQLQVNAFDAPAVQRLSDLIEVQRPAIQPADREGVVMALGCFLGQCMVDTYQGEWAAGPDGSTGVGLAGRLFFNPFFLVSEQLKKGLEQSVSTFFASIPQRLEAPQQRKSWIK